MAQVSIQTTPFRKARAPAAVDICREVELSAEAKSFLIEGLSPQAFLALLVEHEHTGDAVRFIANLLPIREGVWWACTVANAVTPPSGSPARDCILRAAEWVYQPGDERRRACLASAEAAALEGPGAYAALAAFWSGGSLAPEGMPDVPPDPSLGPIGVAASVLLALAEGDPLQFGERFAQALARATDIANGGNGKLEGDLPIVTGP